MVEQKDKSMPVTTTVTAAVAKRGLERVVDDIYGAAKGNLKRRVARWRTKAKIDTLYKKTRQVRFVKTIWQVEKEVDLQEFYHPTKLRVESGRRTINDLSDIGYDGNVVVQGFVGQGKSIFLRYLTSREMVKGRAIPLFVELRRVQKGQKLVEHLLEELGSLGLGTEEDTLLFLCDQGEVVLFLDGFDEVSESQRTGIITEIEHLAKRYDRLRILISSRPNSGIANSPFFRVFELSPLEGDEYEQVVARIAHSDEIAQNIIDGVRKERGDVRELLTTPLMVALLVFRYGAEHSIPENTVAFYENLFFLLLRRHDKSKAGYVRPRRCGLGDAAIEEVFSAVCYLTRKADKGMLSVSELRSYAKRAMELTGQPGDPAEFLEDIIEITCLILEEGGECGFIHKSVQEYHAACFLKQQPDAHVKPFYEAMVQRWGQWAHELEFLSEMDTYRFEKWFLIPELRGMLGIQNKETPRAWDARTEHVFLLVQHADYGVYPDPVMTAGVSTWVSVPRWFFRKSEYLGAVLFGLENTISGALQRGEMPSAGSGIHGRLQLADIVTNKHCARKLRELLHPMLAAAHAELLRAQERVRSVEETRSLFSF